MATIALDTETRGLSGSLILGTLYKSKNISYTFQDKMKVWKDLIVLAKKEAKRGQCLYVYAYNMRFDFYKIARLNIRGINLKNEFPFICEFTFDYNESIRKGRNARKATIFFLDIWNLFRKDLGTMANSIKDKKLEMPEYLKTEDESRVFTEEELKEIEEYCLNDSRLVLALLNEIKKELKRMDYKSKTIISIGQVAMNCFLSWCKKNNHKELFQDKFKNIVLKPKYAEEIHKGYRYGRIMLKRGECNDAYAVDINNLYSYSATKMNFPDLHSERIIKKVYEILDTRESMEKLIRDFPIGVSKVIMKTPDYFNGTQYGILVSRYKNSKHFPNLPNKYIGGSFTHLELNKAINEGYKVLDIDSSVLFKKAKVNPLVEYFQQCYKLRKSGSKFANIFWKDMVNFLVGKFGQIKPKNEIVIIDPMDIDKYKKMGFELVNFSDNKTEETSYIMIKRGKRKPSKHYHSMICAQVNAYAKMYHYDFLKKIPFEDFLYCDTDNIIFKNKENLKKFPISDNFGDFKVEKEGKSFKAINKKVYRIGNDVKISGARKPKNKQEKLERLKMFEEGIISYPRMIGIMRAKSLDKTGCFEDITADLIEGANDAIIKEEEIREENIYLDENEDWNELRINKVIENDKLRNTRDKESN